MAESQFAHENITRLGNEYFKATPERKEAIKKELKERFNVETLPPEPGMTWQQVAQNVWGWDRIRATPLM